MIDGQRDELLESCEHDAALIDAQDAPERTCTAAASASDREDADCRHLPVSSA